MSCALSSSPDTSILLVSLGGTVDDTGRGARLKQAVGTEDTQRQTLLSSKGCDAVPPIHESSTGLSEILVLSCVRF